MYHPHKYWSTASLGPLAAILIVSIIGCPRGGPEKDTMAKVNGYKVMRAEVDRNYNRQVAGAPQKLNPVEDAALRLNILNQIIDLQLHLQKAEKLGIVATDDEVDTRFNQRKAPYTQEEFQKSLKDTGYTEDELKQDIRRNLTIEKLLNKEIASKVTISDSEIQDYYNSHKADFNLIETNYYLGSILVAFRAPGAPGQPDKPQGEAQARKKIEEVLHRLESGEDFGTLATRFSDDADTARNGGMLARPVPESELKNLDPQTRDAISKLKAGQYSGIITVLDPQSRQPAGYRIIKLSAKEAAGQRALDDPQVQQFIRNLLRGQREQLLRLAYDEALRDGAEVHNYYADQVLKNNGR